MTTCKLFATTLCDALSDSHSDITVRGHRFMRSWIQGVVVEILEDNRIILDDGTGTVMVDITNFLKNQPKEIKSNMNTGDYIMVIGPPYRRSQVLLENKTMLVAHQLIKIDSSKDQEPLWYLEVVEYWNCITGN